MLKLYSQKNGQKMVQIIACAFIFQTKTYAYIRHFIHSNPKWRYTEIISNGILYTEIIFQLYIYI